MHDVATTSALYIHYKVNHILMLSLVVYQILWLDRELTSKSETELSILFFKQRWKHTRLLWLHILLLFLKLRHPWPLNFLIMITN